MATISLRVDDATRDELEMFARARDSSLSELLRNAIDSVLERDLEQHLKQPGAPGTLSLLDRQVLALHHETLAMVLKDLDRRKYHRQRAEVLKRGFTLEYGDEFIELDPELSRNECLLVQKILEMFRILGSSLDHLEPDAAADLGPKATRYFSFRGFDFNDRRESRFASYVDYLVSTGRWTEQAEFISSGERGNSHAPMLPLYRRMHSVYSPIWHGKIQEPGLSPESMLYTVEELRQVLAAATGQVS